MKVITLNELKKEINAYIKENGDKKILLSDDDEGNGYHRCFFAFTKPSNDIFFMANTHGVEIEDAINNYVILG